MFGFGQPSGIKDQILQAISGAKKTKPSEKEQKKLVEAVAGSKVLQYGLMGKVGPEQLLGLLSGQVSDVREAMAMYQSLNQSFYGRSAPTGPVEPVPMAKGGIVTKPMNAVVGEAGPEAVIPLNRAQQYSQLDQREDSKDMVMELKKQNQQVAVLIKNMGNAKTILNVDGRQLAESVGQGAYDINMGV